jgi:hypothetical protein
VSKYELYTFNSETAEYELTQTYGTYRAAANARDLTLSCNGRMKLYEFQIRASGVDKPYAFELRVKEGDREVVIETLETLEVAEIERDYEVKYGHFPADSYRIVAVEEVN